MRAELLKPASLGSRAVRLDVGASEQGLRLGVERLPAAEAPPTTKPVKPNPFRAYCTAATAQPQRCDCTCCCIPRRLPCLHGFCPHLVGEERLAGR